MEIDDILARAAQVEDNGVQTPEQTPPPEPEPQAVKPPQQEDPRVPLAALLDERGKRQELEMQLRAYHQAQQKPSSEDYYDNPEKVIGSVRAEMDQKIAAMRMDISEAAMRSAKPDFDQKLDAFEEAVKLNPALGAALRQHPNPAFFAYQEGGKHQLFKETGGDLSSFREKLKAEILASMAQQGGGKPIRVAVPDTLSGVTSMQGAPDKDFEQPSLKDILRGNYG